MTLAQTSGRAVGMLLVAVLLALGPTAGHAVAQAAQALTAAAEVGHDHNQGDEGHDCVLRGTGTVLQRLLSVAPAPRAASCYPGTAVAATVTRPVSVTVAGHSDHNRRLAALQVFRC